MDEKSSIPLDLIAAFGFGCGTFSAVSA
jgi:hypothetical protein